MKSSDELLMPSTSNVLAPSSVRALCFPVFPKLLQWVQKMPLCIILRQEGKGQDCNI